MRALTILATALVLGLAAPAFAAEEPPKDAKKEKDGGLFGSADNVVPLPVLIMPVVSKETIATHLYMFLAAVTPSSTEAKALKEKMPYILDAMIIALYAHIPSVETRDTEPDYTALVRTVKDAINSTMGSAICTDIKVGKIDTAPY